VVEKLVSTCEVEAVVEMTTSGEIQNWSFVGGNSVVEKKLVVILFSSVSLVYPLPLPPPPTHRDTLQDSHIVIVAVSSSTLIVLVLVRLWL
jgi:hypothetical protein